jgi:hypothetical protein
MLGTCIIRTQGPQIAWPYPGIVIKAAETGAFRGLFSAPLVPGRF